jgi:hypothetical protein
VKALTSSLSTTKKEKLFWEESQKVRVGQSSSDQVREKQHWIKDVKDELKMEMSSALFTAIIISQSS